MLTIKRAALLICVTIIIIAVVTSLRSITRSKPVIAEISTMPVIIIDAGHGGIDGGATVDGVVEKDINLAISLILRDMFVTNGFEVVMTRVTDVSIHDEGITSTKKQKTSDLHNRLAIVDAYPNAIFLSIHQNKFSSGRANGAQIFYSPNDPGSRELAEILQKDFSRMLQPGNKRQCKKAGKNLYLMYKSKCPAALIECGFMSNSEEVARLTDPDYQGKIAFTSFCSVMRFLELDAAVDA